MAQDGARMTEAQQNQVPPTLRRWIQDQAMGVERIDRFNSGNERHGKRGWKFEASMVSLRNLPDGYTFAYTSARDSNLIVQVREE